MMQKSVAMHGLALGLLALLGPGRALAQEEASSPGLEFSFEEIVTLGPSIAVGQTPRGYRNIVPITGGTFEGPDIKGTILPGGWDWQLTRPDGCTEIEADYMLKTHDGVVINVINEGVLCPPKDGVATPVRTQPRFEAPLGRYGWLNSATFIGTLEMAPGMDEPAVKIRFYRAT